VTQDTKATKAQSAAKREPAPDDLVLRYTGKGMGAWLLHVPARDLTRADIERLEAEKIISFALLRDCGLYEEV